MDIFHSFVFFLALIFVIEVLTILGRLGHYGGFVEKLAVTANETHGAMPAIVGLTVVTSVTLSVLSAVGLAASL